MLGYEIKTGTLFDFNSEGAFYLGRGFSGLPPHTNDPKSAKVAHVGPLPAAVYKIGKAYTHPELGPLCFDLTPVPGTGDMFGRSLFRIHGASAAHPATSSHGCIVLDHPIRQGIAEGGDEAIIVLPELPVSPAY